MISDRNKITFDTLEDLEDCWDKLREVLYSLEEIHSDLGGVSGAPFDLTKVIVSTKENLVTLKNETTKLREIYCERKDN